jgi:hypothetical protein
LCLKKSPASTDRSSRLRHDHCQATAFPRVSFTPLPAGNRVPCLKRRIPRERRIAALLLPRSGFSPACGNDGGGLPLWHALSK